MIRNTVEAKRTETKNRKLGPLTKLKANIDAVKRRSGFDAIKENYENEKVKVFSNFTGYVQNKCVIIFSIKTILYNIYIHI